MRRNEPDPFYRIRLAVGVLADPKQPLERRLSAYFTVLGYRAAATPDVLEWCRDAAPGLAAELTARGGLVVTFALEYTVGPDGQLRCALPTADPGPIGHG